jgi:hypothetical protein
MYFLYDLPSLYNEFKLNEGFSKQNAENSVEYFRTKWKRSC